MLDTLQLDHFTPLQGETFHLSLGENADALPLRLSAASSLGEASATGRRPFALLFAGPLQPVLPQSIYHLEHESLGALDIFLVPLGPENDAMRYEAIFT